MKKNKALSIVLVSVMSLLFSASLVFARAGGGESFGGGGFSTGGGFSGGGGGFGGFFIWPFFGLGGGGGIFTFLFIIFLFFIFSRIFSARSKGWTVPMGNQPINIPQYHEPDLSVITTTDPAFSKERFLDRAQTAFFSIQNAWMKKDLSTVRGYMTDAQYQRLQSQIDGFNKRGVTNMLEEIAVGNVKIVKIEKDAKYESIECSIWASMIDYKVDDQSKKVVEGNPKHSNQFIEYWTFIRSINAKTKETDSLITKTCPNCGAPLQINESGQCNYCHAYVISGDFDWVLSDISQQLN